jgi:hypothetical protein
MNTALFSLSENEFIAHPLSGAFNEETAQLVLCFGGKELLLNENKYALIKEKFPSAEVVLCSTAGEIYQDKVFENSLVVTALHFDKTKLLTAEVNIRDYSNSYDAAMALASKLPQQGLRYMMAFSDGSLVNGSEMVKGLNAVAGEDILITGGLAGDGANFKSTLVGLNETPVEGRMVAIGFYGDNLIVTHGSQGGWDVFGLEKRITKSTGNVLYEIENQNALELYKKYLAHETDNLPGSALLFPLSVVTPGTSKPVVRTILSIDEEAQSMTFAGDVPVGSKVRFMKANFEKLTFAASIAAKSTLYSINDKPSFSLLISCVGRKLILGSQTEKELEAVKGIFGEATIMSGFYSYGEISPFNEENNCQLHNQTMTITSFFEN